MSLNVPSPAEIPAVVEALASWQREGAPVQLHPGDLGWEGRHGSDRLASALRVWDRDGVPVAVALLDLDEPGLARLAVSPTVDDDVDVAAEVVADLTDPARGVLPAGKASVEARAGTALRAVLTTRGWTPDEAWACFRLTGDLPPCGLRLAVLDASAAQTLVDERVAVQRAAFARSTFTCDLWHAMAATAAYALARCVVGYDGHDTPVAAATVWSAGAGRPGIVEPLGAHPAYRGRGHGRAITLAAAHVLRDLGASSMTVATPCDNAAAVAAYERVMTRLPDVTDYRRPSASTEPR